MNTKEKNYTTLEKKIRKVVEETIVSNAEEFIDIFGEDVYKSALKHKSKISIIAVDTDALEELIKQEVIDCISLYDLNKTYKKSR